MVCGVEREARVVAPLTEAILIAGGDADDLERGLGWMRAKGPTAAALSFGLAGGLDPELAVGDLVCAREVWDGERGFPTDPIWTARIAEATGATIVDRILGRDAVAAGRTIKASLHARTGAAVVDMESHLLARWAYEDDTPLAVLRAVSDGAGDTLPSSALAGFGGARPKVGAVLRRLAVRPGELPALIGTARQVDRGLRRLAAAVADLGPDLGVST